MRFTKHLTLAALAAAATFSGSLSSPAGADTIGGSTTATVGRSQLQPADDFAAVNLAPEFNDYIQCVSSWMYTDFVDPDGVDAELSVVVAGFKNGVYTVRPMSASTSGHGTFFFIDRAPQGLLGSSFYLIKATDQGGASTGWIYVSPSCNGTQVG